MKEVNDLLAAEGKGGNIEGIGKVWPPVRLTGRTGEGEMAGELTMGAVQIEMVRLFGFRYRATER